MVQQWIKGPGAGSRIGWRRSAR